MDKDDQILDIAAKCTRMTGLRPQHVFTRAELGCHADGAFGHDHCRAVLASLIADTFGQRPETRPFASVPRVTPIELVAALEAPMSDDAWEEDLALDVLNEACEEGVYFTFECGDLMLVSAAECEVCGAPPGAVGASRCAEHRS